MAYCTDCTDEERSRLGNTLILLSELGGYIAGFRKSGSCAEIPSGLRTTVRLAKLEKITRFARFFPTSPSGAVVVQNALVIYFGVINGRIQT